MTSQRIFGRPRFSEGSSGGSHAGGGRGVVVLNGDLSQFSDVQTRLLFVAGDDVTLLKGGEDGRRRMQ